MVGFALMSMRFMMRMTRVANAYPRQRENIYLRAYQSSLCSLTTRVGMANPIPDPITLDPTIMEVASALFAGKNQQVAILAGMFRMKGCPITKIRQPRTTQLKLALMKQERTIPTKYMELPTIMPNLMPFLSRRQLAGMLTTRYPRKERMLARLTTLLSTEYILTILVSRGMMILLSNPLRTIMMEANTRIIHRYLVQPYYPQQRVSWGLSSCPRSMLRSILQPSSIFCYIINRYFEISYVVNPYLYLKSPIIHYCLQPCSPEYLSWRYLLDFFFIYRYLQYRPSLLFLSFFTLRIIFWEIISEEESMPSESL